MSHPPHTAFVYAYDSMAVSPCSNTRLKRVAREGPSGQVPRNHAGGKLAQAQRVSTALESYTLWPYYCGSFREEFLMGTLFGSMVEPRTAQ